ncbi:MAG TPA: S9 family peptidase [Pyrinomonadaceae bacterium]|jgi:dipeptidyl aminopeptidase/acylaminoacyl peptidase|nr:S9 family peptidase [Pyrinomonadaceae bacterium]
MNRKRFALLLLLSLCWAAPLRAQETPAASEPKKLTANAPDARAKDGKRLLSALDLMKVAAVGSPRISPDGSRVAYTVGEVKMEKDKEWKTVTQVWIVPTTGGKAMQYTRGDKSSTAPEWSPDGSLLAFLSDREKDGERQVWMMMANGGEAWAVTSHKGGVSGFRWSPDGKQLLLTATDQANKDEEDRKKVKDDTIVIDRDIKMSHLWLWDIDKKTGKRLTEGDFTVSDPQWSPDGTRITYTTRPTPKADDGSLSDVWIMTLASGEKKRLEDNPGSSDSARWSPDGKWIAYTGSPDPNGGVSTSFLYLVPPAGGTPKELTTKFDLSVGTPVWSRDGKTIYFSTNVLEAIEVYSADAASGSVKQLSERGGSTGITEISRDGKTIVGTTSTAKQPTELYTASAELKSLKLLTDQNAWLKDYALAETEVVKWKSKDGMEVEGLLTKPVGYEAGKRVPFLLNPHGGPTGASLNSFTSTVQVLAANGFAVLQPNFRGSTGKGLAFAQANKNTWGKGDYEDCMTGVDAMIASGIADPDRLGAFGWSYGGYMTFWILTQTDRFKAVSPGAGLSNIYSMYSQNDIQRYLRWFYSDKSPWEATELYWSRSPMAYVKNVKTPTMIMHGQVDTRVPIAQAQEFYMALKEMKVPVEFVVYPRENHGFTEPRHQMDRVQRYVKFFAKYLNAPVVTEPTGQ